MANQPSKNKTKNIDDEVNLLATIYSKKYNLPKEHFLRRAYLEIAKHNISPLP